MRDHLFVPEAQMAYVPGQDPKRTVRSESGPKPASRAPKSIVLHGLLFSLLWENPDQSSVKEEGRVGSVSHYSPNSGKDTSTGNTRLQERHVHGSLRQLATLYLLPAGEGERCPACFLLFYFVLSSGPLQYPGHQHSECIFHLQLRLCENPQVDSSRSMYPRSLYI